MSLNVSFKGFVSDENDNPIDCNFQVHYVRQGVWNSMRSTSTAYYSCNAGDADSLTQTGDLKSGDVILLTFWQGDGSGGVTPDNRDNLFDRFGTYAITHDGVTADYTINVQIRPKLVPDISWSIPSTARLNDVVTASDYSDDESVWDYNGLGVHHRNSYYGVIVFPRVGLLVTTYDWGDTNAAVTGYESPNVHTFTVVNDYTVAIKVVNAWTLESNATLPVRIKYNVPIGYATFTPDGVGVKVHTTESSTVLAGIVDEDSRITNIDHNWVIKDRDTLGLISRTLTGNNTTLNFSYDEVINVLQKHYAEQVITYNDGWEILTVTYTRELTITNWLPLVNFSYQFLNETKIRFIPVCSDIDGVIVEYKWELYSLVPFTSGVYSLAKTDIFTVSDDDVITFDSSAHYKMVLTVKDDVGGVSSFASEFDVTSGGTTCVSATMIEDDVFFMIPDEIDY